MAYAVRGAGRPFGVRRYLRPVQGTGKDAFHAKKKSPKTEREQTTALLILRALEAGIPISDLDFFELGEIYDILVEHGNDGEEYVRVATQEDMDRF